MKQTLSNNDIYEIIRSEIINFTYPPGSFISEAEFTKRFNISRTPIREILKRLEHDQMVNIIPNKGTQIAPIDFKLIINFMYIREKLECGMLEELTPIVSQETIAQLTLCIAKQAKIITSDLALPEKAKAFYELDNEFHKSIFSALNKSELWTYFTKLLPDYVRFRTMVTELHTQKNLESLLSQHNQILDCIMNEDLPAMKKIYKTHVSEGFNLFREIILKREDYFQI